MKRKKESLKQFLDRCWIKPSEEETRQAEKEVWSKIQEELKGQDTSLWSLDGDGWNAPALNLDEFRVLTATQMIAGRGSLADITRDVAYWDEKIQWGRVAVILKRLETRKLVKQSEIPGRFEGEKIFGWQLTEDGDRALRRAKEEGKQLVEVRADVKDGLTEESR